MADGLCTGGPIGDVIENAAVNVIDNAVVCEKTDSMEIEACVQVKNFYMASESAKLFAELCAHDGGVKKHEGYPSSSCEEDCRKKRCVDRYDSSESSDSGVAVLSCTDCSGSSTASSDITEPGSPFSTASSHSEDSGSQPAKMPPTPTAHHPPWPWTADEAPSCKRPLTTSHQQDKTATAIVASFEQPPCKKRANNIQETSSAAAAAAVFGKLEEPLKKSQAPQHFVKILPSAAAASPVNHYFKAARKCEANAKLQQGKITEYFKSQVKSKGGMKKDLFQFNVKQAELKRTAIPLVDHQTQLFNSVRTQTTRSKEVAAAAKKLPSNMRKAKKQFAPLTVPRKILPAPPTHITDKLTINEQLNNIAKFTPTVTLTALSFPPNYTYLHTKTTKQQTPDSATTPIFVPQFATIGNNDKLAGCLNVLQPMPKMAAINNFSCVKLNGATVVPIVKVAARLNAATNTTSAPPPLNISHTVVPPTVALSVDTAVPTVLTAKPRVNENSTSNTSTTSTTSTNSLFSMPKQHSTPQEQVGNQYRTQPHRTEERQEICRSVGPSPTPTDSDSGISSSVSSNKECFELLEVRVDGGEDVAVAVEQQKSPILSKPKTIRFPVKRIEKDERKTRQQQHSGDGGVCQWAECDCRFETNGALLEHLQVKHVISQATQEHYVCLWLGCKVHGRTSCSRTWLERHVLAHAGTKPFRCIVEGCGQRFNSQLMLERHVNGHFNSDGSPNNTAKKSPENGTCKLLKRNGKRIRFRRQPWSARMFDFIDSGIMEGLQHKLLIMTQNRTLGKVSDAGDTVHLQSQVLAKRIDNDGNVNILLKWHPTDVIPDEWVPEKEYKPTRIVSIPRLDASSKNVLKPCLFPEHHQQQQPARQKQRRKPMSKQT